MKAVAALGAMIEKFGGLAPLHPELFKQAIAAYHEAADRSLCQQCMADHTGFYCTGEPAYFKEARAAIAKATEPIL